MATSIFSAVFTSEEVISAMSLTGRDAERVGAGRSFTIKPDSPETFSLYEDSARVFRLKDRDLDAFKAVFATPRA